MSTIPHLGFGLYRHMLTAENFQFARQAGAGHVVVHLVDYTGQLNSPSTNQRRDDQPVGGREGWAKTNGDRTVWSREYLSELKRRLAAHGLTLYAIENFDPAHWYDVLLGGPKRDEQIEGLKEIIRTLGAVGIPVMGYNFSIAGVAGRIHGPFARGSAESVAVDGVDDTPIPNGMVWNMTYDQQAPPGNIPETTQEELWERLRYFLERILPVAEEAGVVLAAHPDDPPAPVVRRQPRLVYLPELYDRLFELVPSDASKAELCLGTVQEMAHGDVYELVDRLTANNKVGYIHFRNVIGKVPNYHEVFIDEGEIDPARIMRILLKNRYDGVIIPDHTPKMACAAPWHSGMAYAMGYMQALLRGNGYRDG
jgi:mannonate dehydratase